MHERHWHNYVLGRILTHFSFHTQAQEEGLLNIEISMGEVPGTTSYIDEIRPLFHRVSMLYCLRNQPRCWWPDYSLWQLYFNAELYWSYLRASSSLNIVIIKYAKYVASLSPPTLHYIIFLVLSVLFTNGVPQYRFTAIHVSLLFPLGWV